MKVRPERSARLYPYSVDICYLLPIFPQRQTSTHKKGQIFPVSFNVKKPLKRAMMKVKQAVIQDSKHTHTDK